MIIIDGDELGKFAELRVLNMQSNGIEKLNQVTKLKTLEHLRTLTLFANPVEQKKNYRWFVDIVFVPTCQVWCSCIYLLTSL